MTTRFPEARTRARRAGARRGTRSAAVAVLSAAGLLAAASTAGAVPFASPDVMTVSPTEGPFLQGGVPNAKASLYPSAIQVAGQNGSIAGVTVTLNSVSHAWPADLDVLLVGPEGQQTMLMSDVCGRSSQALNAATFTFDDAAPAGLAPFDAQCVSGTYKPTNSTAGREAPSDSNAQDNLDFPAPEPFGAEYGAAFTQFIGANPNGTWQLFVTDDSENHGGTIAGWSIDITLSAAPPTTFTPPAATIRDTVVCNPLAPQRSGNNRPGRITLTERQARIDQRIFSAGVLRANAIDKWLADGIEGRDLCGGAFAAADFASSIRTGATGAQPQLAAPTPRPVVVPKLQNKPGVSFSTSRGQLLINRRIAVALKRRALALEARVNGRLTGGDVDDGVVAIGKLRQGLTVLQAPVGTKPASSKNVKGANVPLGRVGRDVATVRTSQQIAADGIRVLNRVRARLAAGLSGTNFQDGTIAYPNLEPALRRS